LAWDFSVFSRNTEVEAGMKVTIIGAGYVGLVSGVCFADFGHDVVCVDNDPAKIEILLAGKVPIFEPDLDRLIASNVRDKRLSFTTDIATAVAGAEIVFIAVGTPSRRGDGHADLQFIFAAARDIALALDGYTVVVTKSTVPVGTGDEVERIIRQHAPTAEFSVVSNPEFLREGAAIRDFKLPDRIVVGTDDERARGAMTNVYRPLYLNRSPILFTERRTAELIKYAANAFLATKITFINKIADLCEKVGADVQQVARGIGLDNRIGSKFLHAGPGFGGSCFPKDTLALIKTGQDYEAPLRIVEAVAAVNETRKRGMARKVFNILGGDVRGKTIAVLGLTFKPNTDDMRDAPSIPLIAALIDRGAHIRAFDPEGTEPAKAVLPAEVVFCADAYDAATGADALVIATEWEQFRALDFKRLKGLMSNLAVVDLRNVYEGEEIEKLGFDYEGVGRKKRKASERPSLAAE
jgi:UDPglucose 6-dehydrogenase